MKAKCKLNQIKITIYENAILKCVWVFCLDLGITTDQSISG